MLGSDAGGITANRGEPMRRSIFLSLLPFAGAILVTFSAERAIAQVVPGTGTLIDFVGDNLESDENWGELPLPWAAL